MRFAGTWKQYSKKAMPQLTAMTFHSASLRYLRWPYQAKVLKCENVSFYRFANVFDGAFLGVTLTDAAWQAGALGYPKTVLAGIEDHLSHKRDLNFDFSTGFTR